MKLIRDQIQNPDKEIITFPFWIHNDYPDNMLGINIITKPSELKSFLIVFDLFTKSDKYRVGICIPGYDEHADKVYKNIETMLCSGSGNLDIETNNFINFNFDIRNKENALFPIQFWQELFD